MKEVKGTALMLRSSDSGRTEGQTEGQTEGILNEAEEIHHIKKVLGFIWASGISHLFGNMTVITAIKVLVWSRGPTARRLLLLSCSDRGLLTSALSLF